MYTSAEGKEPCITTSRFLSSSFFFFLFVPRFRESAGTLNLIRSSVRLSVRPSICHKNFNLGHNFCTITGRALILGMCVLCDKTFSMVPCSDLDGDLWPTSRSNMLPSGRPQFSEFAWFFFFLVIKIFGKLDPPWRKFLDLRLNILDMSIMMRG